MFFNLPTLQGDTGPLAVTGNSLMAGKASFDTKLTCLNEVSWDCGSNFGSAIS